MLLGFRNTNFVLYSRTRTSEIITIFSTIVQTAIVITDTTKEKDVWLQIIKYHTILLFVICIIILLPVDDIYYIADATLYSSRARIESNSTPASAA